MMTTKAHHLRKWPKTRIFTDGKQLEHCRLVDQQTTMVIKRPCSVQEMLAA
jgi:hypothetical protein